ncbi:MAG: hypothetical protein ACOY5W_06670 [Pseudomonadota bacterium]
MSGRRLPPFAKSILAARRAGSFRGQWGASPDGRSAPATLCIGSDAWTPAWEWAGHRLITLLPPGEDPGSFDWRCLAGSDPVLLWRCGEVDGGVMNALLVAVMRDGTDRVLDLATGSRYVARVEEAHDERAA